MKHLEELIDRFLAYGIPSVDICVMRHGEVIYRRMEGYSDAARAKPINGTERYNIYSCSKPMTVTAAMRLFERGEIRFEDNISDYLPEFSDMEVNDNGNIRPAKRRITIRDLLSMQAGLTYDLHSDGIRRGQKETSGRCPTREMMRYIASEPLAFDPGAQYEYSLCHDVIAALVEVVSGKHFGEYMRDNFFEPLGMHDTTYLPTPDDIAGLAAQYRYDEKSGRFIPIGGENEYRLGSEYESGGAGCVTTVNDYMKFLEGWRTGKTVKRDTLELFASDQMTSDMRKYFGQRALGYTYGLGLRCEYEYSGSSDFGWGGAACSYLACDLKHDFTVFSAQHVLNSPNRHLRDLIAGVIRNDFSDV